MDALHHLSNNLRRLPCCSQHELVKPRPTLTSARTGLSSPQSPHPSSSTGLNLIQLPVSSPLTGASSTPSGPAILKSSQKQAFPTGLTTSPDTSFALTQLAPRLVTTASSQSSTQLATVRPSRLSNGPSGLLATPLGTSSPDQFPLTVETSLLLVPRLDFQLVHHAPKPPQSSWRPAKSHSRLTHSHIHSPIFRGVSDPEMGSALLLKNIRSSFAI